MNKTPNWNRKLIIPILLMVNAITACRIGAVTVQPTPPPKPTAVPVQPTQFEIPTISMQSEVTIPELQFTEVAPEILTEDSILIQSPQTGANISGALLVQGISDPTFEQNLVIRLVGENGDELVRTNTIIQADAGTRGNFSTSINIPSGESVPSLLQVFSTNPKDSSLVHLSSVTVFLNSGNSEGSPVDNKSEHILIKSVKQSGTGTDALIEVNGIAWSLFENTLNYAVCGETSGTRPDMVCGTLENRLVEGVVTTSTAEMGLPGEFTITIPGSVSLPPSATIVVYSVSPMNGAIEHAASHRLIVN
jgi:hypothetical protein